LLYLFETNLKCFSIFVKNTILLQGKHTTMKKYLHALLADLAEAKNNRPPVREVQDDEFTPFELEEFMESSMEDSADMSSGNAEKTASKSRNIRETMGLEREQFPPADYWSEEEAAQLVIALNDLLKHYNLSADYPETLPPLMAYTTLVGALEKYAPIMPFGEWHLEFCDYNPEECPFGEPYCTCGKWREENAENKDKTFDFDRYDANNISGVHNYCDAWCERCPFTDRCAVANGRWVEDTDDKNRYTLGLWEDHQTQLLEAKAWLYENTDDYNTTLKPLTPERQIFDKEENEIRRDVHSVAVIQLSERYQKEVTEWLKLDEHKTLYSMIEDHSKMRINEQGKATLEQFMVIQWYVYFIFVKFMRAVKGKMDDADYMDDDDDYPKDSDGSAKIALLGAERSFVAWHIWANLYTKDTALAMKMMILLQAIIKEGDKECPDARNFIRPGFDEKV
jgi:hypothetical protein